MKRQMKTLTLLLGVAMLLSACGGGGNSGTALADSKPAADSRGTEAAGAESGQEDGGNTSGTQVTIGFSSEGDTFDPCNGFGYTGSPIYSNLVRVNGDNQLENDLATEYTVSGDALTWTFKIGRAHV